MKFKKLLISASAIAAGSGLLATVLTSCAKASVDDKLKVKLDAEGNLYKAGKMKTFTWKDAVTTALNNSSNWAQFKNALAEEIVFSWYEDRASSSKSDKSKNSDFRSNLDEWNYSIDQDYKNVIQTCKNKYGSNWEFYLQNEYLAPNGGTEAAYKKNKLVEKVKSDFISKVFAKSYFGYRTGELNTVLPHTYTEASKDISVDKLRNPNNWGNIGFFARADLSYPVTDKPTSAQDIDYKQLAKHPDGDYAAIQDYVFNRWFKTEKPFFSAAALFKYSMPKYSATKLDEIYNASFTQVKIPDKPNEAFPFFGEGTDGSTIKAVKFLEELEKGSYATSYNDGTASADSNGTVTINLKQTDDSQTLLLVTGSTMFGSLYTPYAMAAGSLYDQMMGGTARTFNISTKQTVTDNLKVNTYGIKDDFAMLSNFFFTTEPTPETGYTWNCLDLNKVYGGLSGDEYHCPLFKENKVYNHFYGDTTKTGSEASGIRYITNNIQVDDFKFSTLDTDKQPWVMELNEAGVHFQTIDGYNYIKNGITGDTETTDAARLARQKKVVMYRLLQKQVEKLDCFAKDDILGEKGKVQTYFNDNFADIILELALLDATDEHQIFRSIDSYKETSVSSEKYFLNQIFNKESQTLGSNFELLTNYLKAILAYDSAKKGLNALESANSKILSYRSKQITNSKTKEPFAKTIYENGLLAPFVYAPVASELSKHDYSSVNRIVVHDIAVEHSAYLTQPYNTTMNSLAKAVVDTAYATDAINNASGFAPQITEAQSKSSNRFWFKSRIVDKALHSFMANKAFTANQIKMNAYQYYTETKDTETKWLNKIFADGSSSNNAFLTTYARSKLLSGDKNLSTYVENLDSYGLSNFYSTMSTEFDNYMNRAKIDGGEVCDDALNLQLLKATIMWLVGSDKTTNPEAFDNFYSILNSKVSENELAFVGYMSRAYANSSMGDTFKNNDVQVVNSSTTLDYEFNADVDNNFDRMGYSGKTKGDSTDKGVKLSSSNYWNAIYKNFNGTDDGTRAMSGFMGLQTKSNNQIDSETGLQKAIFEKFATTTYKSYDLSQTTATQNDENKGCWFQFAGTKDNNGNPLIWNEFKFDDGTSYTTCKVDEWFPNTETDNEYAAVRKVAKKIIERDHEDDLRSLAKQLGNCYKGYSYFSEIGSGSVPFPKGIDQMKMTMLKLLPSKLAAQKKEESGSGFEKSHDIATFKRLVNVEARTESTQSPSCVFEDNKSAYKLLLTQVNKADIVEKTLHPTWDADNNKWVTTGPITPEEFWVIFFNIASESTVQQRVISEVVKTAFGDEKLIVYDAQLYNQFDSIWIKDWTKKTIGA